MILQIPRISPSGAALNRRAGPVMDVVLHIGAHRTGSTTYQACLRAHRHSLDKARVGFWGPRRTRNGLFRGLLHPAPAKPGRKNAQERAVGRVQLRLEQARQKGLQAVLISDENMIGSVRECLRTKQLYPSIGERMARFARAFEGQITRIAFCIRSQDRFWGSAMAYGVSRGHPIPRRGEIDRIAESMRSWRDVITDLSCAVPDAEIRVLPYESFYANPLVLTRDAVGLDVQFDGGYDWLNRAPHLPELRAILTERGQDVGDLPDMDGPWNPFSEAQTTDLRERFADDLFWLANGAEGLAKLTEEAMPRGRGKAHRSASERGQGHDEEGRLGKTG
jgi:hypothetical protein